MNGRPSINFVNYLCCQKTFRQFLCDWQTFRQLS